MACRFLLDPTMISKALFLGRLVRRPLGVTGAQDKGHERADAERLSVSRRLIYARHTETVELREFAILVQTPSDSLWRFRRDLSQRRRVA